MFLSFGLFKCLAHALRKGTTYLLLFVFLLVLCRFVFHVFCFLLVFSFSRFHSFSACVSVVSSRMTHIYIYALHRVLCSLDNNAQQ